MSQPVASEMRLEQRALRLARLERWTEWPLTVLSLALLPILLAPHLFTLSSHEQAVLDELDYLIWGAFAADLLVKVLIAPKRVPYLRRHWIDVCLVALPMLRPLRLFRSLRAVRLLRASRAVIALLRSLEGIRTLLSRRGLQYVLGIAVIIVIACGSLVTVFEKGATDTTIHDLPDGLWWAVTTVTTVGYGDTYPKTAIGRGIGVALMLLGITLFGVVTANLAAFFVEEKENEMQRELRMLREEVRRLADGLSSGSAGRDP